MAFVPKYAIGQQVLYIGQSKPCFVRDISIEMGDWVYDVGPRDPNEEKIAIHVPEWALSHSDAHIPEPVIDYDRAMQGI